MFNILRYKYNAHFQVPFPRLPRKHSGQAFYILCIIFLIGYSPLTRSRLVLTLLVRYTRTPFVAAHTHPSNMPRAIWFYLIPRNSCFPVNSRCREDGSHGSHYHSSMSSCNRHTHSPSQTNSHLSLTHHFLITYTRACMSGEQPEGLAIRLLYFPTV